VARHNGRRSADNRRRRSREARQAPETASHESKKVSGISDNRPAANDQDLVGGRSVDVQSNGDAPELARNQGETKHQIGAGPVCE
jgi:hypothetical protein